MAYRDVLREDNLEKGIYKALIAITNSAKMFAPVDSGALRNSISWNTRHGSGGFNNGQVEKAPGSAKITPETAPYVGAVGTGLEYAAAVEYGRPDLPLYPAQPYLRPSAKYIKSRLAGIIGKELLKEITDMANKHYPFRGVAARAAMEALNK